MIFHIAAGNVSTRFGLLYAYSQSVCNQHQRHRNWLKGKWLGMGCLFKMLPNHIPKLLPAQTVGRYTPSINQSQKSHNASDTYPSMHHCTLWDMGLVHFLICAIGLLRHSSRYSINSILTSCLFMFLRIHQSLSHHIIHSEHWYIITVILNVLSDKKTRLIYVFNFQYYRIVSYLLTLTKANT